MAEINALKVRLRLTDARVRFGRRSSFVTYTPATGHDREGWSERCSAACYDLPAQLHHQLDHRHLDRDLIRDEPDLPVQVDFYYPRDGVPGVCIFVDGPAHAAAPQADHDRQLRGALRDRGYRVIEFICFQDLNTQLAQHPDVFR